MEKNVLDEMADGAYCFLRLLVPELENRTPITWGTFPYTIVCFVPLIFMAYLARRPDTRLIRLLLLPATLSIVLHSCLGYVWTGEGMNVYNWGEGLCCLVCIGKTLEYAFVKEGRFKVGEKHLGGMSTPAISKKDYDPKDPTHPANSHIPVTGLNRPGSSFLPLGLQDGFELAFAFRGVGWDFGKYVYIPPERKPLARRPFLIATLNTFALNFLVLDFLESCIKLAPRVGTPHGGSIFVQHLPPTERYALSTALHIASGFALLAGFQMVYDLATLVGVGLLQHDPTSWPPVIDRPWAATSLGELWARRWHQLLRQTFVVFGGVPGHAVGGRVGMVLGTFLASGLYHEASSLAMGRGWDLHVVLFFAAQGVLVLLERAWKRVTGKRVCGWPGRVWVYFVIMVLGQPMIDSWHKKGLGGGLIIPPVISPTRRQIFPLISHLTGYDLSVYPL